MPKILENVRVNIIIEAKKTLLEEGVTAISIRDIAKKCEIGVGTFYNYFATKNDLLLAIFRDDWTKINLRIVALTGTPLPLKEKLRQIDHVLEQFVHIYLDTFITLSAVTGKPGCVETHKYDQIYEALTTLIDHEKETGVITNPLPSVKLSQFILSNLLYLNRHPYMTFDELYDNFKL